jgi:hypothetical protein
MNLVQGEPSIKVHAKGNLLAAHWRAEVLNSQTYTVQGTSGDTHLVALLDDDKAFCSCDATVVCSHIVAARITHERKPE